MKGKQIFRKHSFKRFTALLLSILLVVGDTGLGSISVRAEGVSEAAQLDAGSEKSGGGGRTSPIAPRM